MDQATAERVAKSLEVIASALVSIVEHLSDEDGQTLIGALVHIGDKLDGDDGEGVPQAIERATTIISNRLS